jgi:hypothetical protein
LNPTATASIERIGAIKKLHLQDQCSSTVVEHLSHHPNVQGLNPEATASTGRGEWCSKEAKFKGSMQQHSGRILASSSQGSGFES